MNSAIDLVRRQRRRRLVEDQDPRVDRQRLGDLDRAAGRPSRGRGPAPATSNRTSSSSNSACAARRIAPQSIDPQPAPDGAWPMNTFSATDEVGEEPRLLVDDRDARARGRGPGRGATTGSPSSSTLPLSGWWTPARILTSVLLPAPFSPTSAWTSPARSSSDTSDSAWVAAEPLRDAAQRDGRRAAGAHRPVAAAPRRRHHGAARAVVRDRREPGVAAPVGRRGGPRCPGRADVADHRRRAPAASVTTASRSAVGQNVANAARSHFVWSTRPTTSLAPCDHEALDLRLLLGRVAEARPRSRSPAAPMNAVWMLTLLEQPLAQRPDEAQRLPAEEAAGHRDGDARDGRPALRRCAGRW